MTMRTTTMKAAVSTQYGPPSVLKVLDVPIPNLQAEHEGQVLIEVHAASVNQLDVLYRQGYWPIRLLGGRFKPQMPVLGVDVAGIVTAVGAGVTRFRPGDRVFGGAFGSHAQFVRVRQGGLTHLPDSVSFQQAAALPTASITALQALRDVAQVRAGQSVLINGGSGGVGHFAVQLARHFGARVTAVTSTSNLGWVKDLGADQVIDYTRQDFTRLGSRYDLIFDAAAKCTFWRSRAALHAGGMYLAGNRFKPLANVLQFKLPAQGPQARSHQASHKADDHAYLMDLVTGGQLRPVIERVYPLADIAAAHAHVQGGHTKGKVVIAVR